MITFFVMILGALAGRLFLAIPKKKNDFVQLSCTLLLIFSMGASLGQQDDFFHKLGELGVQSFLFFLLPAICSAAIVYFLTRCFLPGGKAEYEELNPPAEEGKTASVRDPMMFYAIAALLLGIGCGMVSVLSSVLTPLAAYSEWILYLLMFSVGISIGKLRGANAALKSFIHS